MWIQKAHFTCFGTKQQSTEAREALRETWGFQGFMLQKHNCMQIMQRFKTAAQLRSVLKKTLKRMSCRGWQCLWACVYELLHLQHAGISEIPEGGML